MMRDDHCRAVEEDADAASVGRAATKGLRWGFVGSVVTKIISFGSNLVLARLLIPDDFGVYAVALSTFGLLLMINDMGIIAAVVQWPGKFREVAPTATVLAFTASVLIYLACWISAPALAEFAGNGEATPLIRLIAVGILLDGVTAVRSAYLLRTFQQDRMVLASASGAVAQVIVAVGMAIAGFGALSLATAHVVGNVALGALVMWWARVPFRIGIDPVVARRIIRFGLPLAGSLGVEALLLNTDYLIVGRIAGTTALGFYLLAFSVSSWIPGLILNAMRWVAVPGFSRIAGDVRQLSAAVQRSMQYLVVLTIPPAVLLAVFAPPLVAFLYGEIWQPAATALQWLPILGIVRLVTTLAVDVVTSMGRTRVALWLNIGWSAALLPALWFGTQMGGIRGTALAHSVVGILVAIPITFFALARLGVDLGPLPRMLARPLAGGLVSTLVCLAVAHLTGLWPAIVQLAVGGVVGIAAYVLVVVPLARLRVFARTFPWCRPRSWIDAAGPALAGSGDAIDGSGQTQPPSPSTTART